MYFPSRKFQKRWNLTSSYIGPGISIRRGEDRISMLPDHLLNHILSFLTTEETVWTSVLSSRWRYLWKWVPRLQLKTSDFPNDKTCADFIDEFLNFQTESYLREFKLSIDRDDYDSDVTHYTPCLERVISRKIRRFQVENQLGLFNTEVPLTLSVCEALVCLKLHCVELMGLEKLSLPCLKIMYLENVIFPSDAAPEKLISCSPVLEDLKICLSKYDVLVVLRVCSLSLKSFTLKRAAPVYARNIARSVVIDTPRLEYLSLVDYQFKSFKINSMRGSVKVDIDIEFELMRYDVSERNIIYNLLNNFSGVGDIAISWRTLKEFIFSFQERVPLPKFHDLTRLRASMCSNASLGVLPFVLESCPKLKHFTLELVNDYPESVITRLSTVLSHCLVSSLEYVEMKSPITKKATELKLVRYFFKNSTTLKKLVLRLDPSSGEIHEPSLLKQLFEYPRLSSSCQFEVLPLVPPPDLPPGYVYVKPTTSRWRDLWKLVSIIDLDNSDFSHDNTCVAFVDKFLNFPNESYFRRFKLYTNHHNVSDDSSFEACLMRVTECQIRHFVIENYVGFCLILRPIVFSMCDTLVSLKLSFVILSDFESCSLPCLEFMHLKKVIFLTDNAAAALISCSHALRFLWS